MFLFKVTPLAGPAESANDARAASCASIACPIVLGHQISVLLLEALAAVGRSVVSVGGARLAGLCEAGTELAHEIVAVGELRVEAVLVGQVGHLLLALALLARLVQAAALFALDVVAVVEIRVRAVDPLDFGGQADRAKVLLVDGLSGAAKGIDNMLLWHAKDLKRDDSSGNHLICKRPGRNTRWSVMLHFVSFS